MNVQVEWEMQTFFVLLKWKRMKSNDFWIVLRKISIIYCNLVVIIQLDCVFQNIFSELYLAYLTYLTWIMKLWNIWNCKSDVEQNYSWVFVYFSCSVFWLVENLILNFYFCLSLLFFHIFKNTLFEQVVFLPHQKHP